MLRTTYFTPLALRPELGFEGLLVQKTLLISVLRCWYLIKFITIFSSKYFQIVKSDEENNISKLETRLLITVIFHFAILKYDPSKFCAVIALDVNKFVIFLSFIQQVFHFLIRLSNFQNKFSLMLKQNYNSTFLSQFLFQFYNLSIGYNQTKQVALL